jgi:hypothetical protein
MTEFTEPQLVEVSDEAKARTEAFTKYVKLLIQVDMRLRKKRAQEVLDSEAN